MPQSSKVDVKLWNAEYFYAESIRFFNEQRRKEGLPVVTTTMARNLHKIYLDAFQAGVDSRFDVMFGANAPSDPNKRTASIMSKMTFAMTEAFNTAMQSVNGGVDFYAPYTEDNYREHDYLDVDAKSVGLRTVDTRRMIVNINQSFRHETGWNLVDTYVYEHGTPVPVDDDKYVPLSPYDERFATRQVMLDGGSRI